MLQRPLWRLALLCLGVAFALVGLGAPAADLKPRPCDPRQVPPSGTRARDGLTLNIAPRRDAPDKPCQEGWCGETAIQEALLYLGAYFPQKQINAAGHPAHPDLYSNEIPVALRGLGVQIEEWRNTPRGLKPFLDWIQQHLAAFHPVLAGVKVYPTRHQEWGLDHFVNAVGFDKRSITFNTGAGGRSTRTLDQLDSEQQGFAFRNGSGSYYGIAVIGLAPVGEQSVPVRVFVATETQEKLEVVVKCEGLTPGTRYEVTYAPACEAEGRSLHRFRAAKPIYAFRCTLDPAQAVVFRCTAAAAADAK